MEGGSDVTILARNKLRPRRNEPENITRLQSWAILLGKEDVCFGLSSWPGGGRRCERGETRKKETSEERKEDASEARKAKEEENSRFE